MAPRDARETAVTTEAEGALQEPLLLESSSAADNHEESSNEGEERRQQEGSTSTAARSSPNNNNNNNTAAARNVRLTLVYTILAFAGRSLWNQSVLATAVFLLVPQQESAQAVGFITAVQGLCQLGASFPAGMWADGHRRDHLLRFAAALGCLAIVVTLVACRAENYVWLTAALAAWGLCYGVANTTVTALFADSIADGERSHYFTQRSVLVTLGNTAGPLTALLLFAVLGDNWKVKDCAIVMSIGQIVCFPAVILLCFFRDDQRIQEHAAVAASLQEEAELESLSLQQNLLCDEERLLFIEGGADVEQCDESEDDALSTRSNNSAAINIICNGCCIPKHRVIPVLISISDVIGGIGSGCSIRYFPLFFVDRLHLGPVAVQVLYICSPLLQAVLMKLSHRLARTYGRCHVTVAFKWTGIVLMFAMIAAYKRSERSVVLVCILYVLRTGFINSCSALTRSMLMDNVPSHERGKWSALESVNMFSWSGSAAFGGVLVGIFGIVPLFAITAMTQLVSSLVVMLLFGVDTTG